MAALTKPLFYANMYGQVEIVILAGISLDQWQNRVYI